MKNLFRQGFFLFGLFCLLTASASPAQASDLLTLFRQAADNDPIFQAARYQQAATAEAVGQARADLLPKASATYQYMYTSQNIKMSDNDAFAEGKTDYSTEEYTVSLTQPIFRYPSILRLSQARIQVKRGDYEFALARQELMVRVAELYFALLAERDNLNFARAEWQAVQAHHELAEGRFEMGLARITDLHDAKARLAAVAAKVIEAENRLEDARQALREVTAELPNEPAPLAAEFPLLPPEPAEIEVWVAAALQQNLNLEIQRHTLEIARKEVARRRAAHYPTVDLTGRFNSKQADGTLFGGGSEIDTTDLMASINLPLLEGGVVLSRTREAVQLQNRAQEELKQVTRRVVRDTRASFLGVISAVSKAEALEQSVLSQQYAVESKQEGFRSGLYTSLAVLDAERDLYLARQDYAQARYDFILNSLRLKRAAGTLTGNDLAQVNQWLQTQ